MTTRKSTNYSQLVRCLLCVVMVNSYFASGNRSPSSKKPQKKLLRKQKELQGGSIRNTDRWQLNIYLPIWDSEGLGKKRPILWVVCSPFLLFCLSFKTLTSKKQLRKQPIKSVLPIATKEDFVHKGQDKPTNEVRHQWPELKKVSNFSST